MAEKHKLDLHFKSSNAKTLISCKCGEQCGEVVTGTGVPAILKIYRKHIEENDGRELHSLQEEDRGHVS